MFNSILGKHRLSELTKISIEEVIWTGLLDLEKVSLLRYIPRIYGTPKVLAASMDSLRRLTQDHEGLKLDRDLYHTVQDSPHLEELCINGAKFSAKQNKIRGYGVSVSARIVSASLCLIVLWIIEVGL